MRTTRLLQPGKVNPSPSAERKVWESSPWVGSKRPVKLSRDVPAACREGQGGERGRAAAPRVNYYLAGQRGWRCWSHQSCSWFAFLVSVTPPHRRTLSSALPSCCWGLPQVCSDENKQTKPKLVLTSAEGMKFSRSSVQAADFRALSVADLEL